MKPTKEEVLGKFYELLVVARLVDRAHDMEDKYLSMRDEFEKLISKIMDGEDEEGDSYENTYFIVSEADGGETWFPDDFAVLVPYNTLSEERKARIREGDTEKIFQHGGEFSGISINDIIDLLEEKGMMEELMTRSLKKKR